MGIGLKAAMISLAGLALGLSTGTAAGQHMNAGDAPCRDAVVTAEAAACFSRAAADRDKQLAGMLAVVRPVIDGEALTLLDRAQAAWTEYRRLSCEGEYAMYGGGSAGPTARFACLEALTRDRIKQLHDAYDWRIEKNRP